MEKKKELTIREMLKKMLSMEVVGYIVYPSVLLRSYEFNDEDSERFSVDYHHDREKNLYKEARDIYDALFERVVKKSGRKYMLNDNKCTIVLEDDCRKRWYFHTHDGELSFSDGGVRQGWNYEFDPTASKEENKENYFFQRNLWFC